MLTIKEFDSSQTSEVLMMISLTQVSCGMEKPVLSKDLLRIRESYFDKGTKFWVGVDETGQIVSTLGYFDLNGSAFLSRFYVRVDCQRAGYGSKMLQYAEDYLFSHGYSEILVHLVPQFSEYHDFYLKKGYCKTGPLDLVKYKS